MRVLCKWVRVEAREQVGYTGRVRTLAFDPNAAAAAAATAAA